MTFAVDFNIANDWGSGFTANLEIANNSSSNVNGWTLEFEAPFEITNIWGAEIVSQEGNLYTVRNLSYNSTLAADGTVSFGFNGSGDSLEPTGYSLNGESIGTSPSIPTLSVDNVTVTEGDSGTVAADFVVNLSEASDQPVTVEYSTANGTATAGSDYTAQSGTITFAAGETSKIVSVPVIGDTTVESNETFRLNLSNPSNGTIADAQGVGTISNDDSSTPPANTPLRIEAEDYISFFDKSSGNTGGAFRSDDVDIQATTDVGGGYNVGWIQQGEWLTYDANIPEAGTYDIVARVASAQSGTRSLKVSVGGESETLSFGGTGGWQNWTDVTAQGVNLSAGSQQLRLDMLSNSFNVNYIDIIPSNSSPTPPTLSINDVSLTEGNSGTKNATFTVNLSDASTQSVSVNYATANDTAIAGSDYTAKSGTLNFSPGQTSKTFTVPIIGDTLDEANETFKVNLSQANNATIADGQGVGTIIDNDDSTPVLSQLSINDVSVTEGDSGTKNATFTVNLSAASTQSVSVNYATANDTAIAGSDYTAKSGTLSFNPGQTSKTFSVPILGDTTVEGDETFKVNLSQASNATIGDGQGVGTILNNDSSQPPPQQGAFNYGEALQKSILFYYAQRSGDLPDTNPLPWRGDSALNDGSDVGVDLTGGYYDAGDHVKFGLPGAASMTMLSWGAVEYQDAYQQSGQFEEILDSIKWGTDYILKAHVTDSQGTQAFYGQVGDGNLDHAFWGAPEDMTMERPAFKIDRQNPGSDLAGEAAASLAAASIVFRGVDEAYADTLLQNAQQLYDFADQYRGVYTDAIPDAGQFYNSFSGFQDELVWGATWLHKATEAAGSTDTTYLNKAESLYQGIGPGFTQSWDNKSYGSAILLAQETGKSEYKGDVEGWLNSWLPGGSTPTYTDGGLAWLSQWGSLRYSANTSFLAGVYADTVNDPNGQYSDFAEGQIDYILGDNPRNFSYMVGFGEDYALNPHHRAASGVTNISDSRDNLHTLYGALVGGPDSPNDSSYDDDRSNFITNEVAMDYNAGLTGALARMYGEFGGETLDTISGVNLGDLSALTVADVVAS
ncbi:MAG: glycoside hydrolase family 9 protein [Coleofasciculus sp. D1-CHI-01]|uniref:glycoside hydrolase family 9 protein n=1 Tax=Coleofasciculus sp. D1-CHI-01 TaxID=3068482 RepID=UPI0032FACB92